MSSRSKEIARQVVMRLSRGSPSLSQGRYKTQEDMDREREEFLNYDFTADSRLTFWQRLLKRGSK